MLDSGRPPPAVGLAERVQNTGGIGSRGGHSGNYKTALFYPSREARLAQQLSLPAVVYEDHWLSQAYRAGQRIEIVRYPQCWGCVLFKPEKDGELKMIRGIYYQRRSDLEARLREILGDASLGLRLKPRWQRSGRSVRPARKTG